jgi:xanthine dehydrogenase accessory factor
LRATADGSFTGLKEIGDFVHKGQAIAKAGEEPIYAEISGVLRGILRSGLQVHKGMKVGDIDPRGEIQYCYTVSDKALAVGGGVLEGILRHQAMR